MFRSVIVFIFSFLSVSLLVLPPSAIFTLDILEKYEVKKIWRGIVLVITLVLMSLFITVPICGWIVRTSERDLERTHQVQKEIIQECVKEFLDDNQILMSAEEIDSIANDIFESHQFIDSDDDGFYVKDSCLQSLLTIGR